MAYNENYFLDKETETLNLTLIRRTVNIASWLENLSEMQTESIKSCNGRFLTYVSRIVREIQVSSMRYTTYYDDVVK